MKCNSIHSTSSNVNK